MKRLFSSLLPVVALLVAGALASACTAGSPAATVNGATIAMSTVNEQLRAFESTSAGACLLTLETAQSTGLQLQGAGGPGTFDTTFVDTVLDSSVGNVVASQYAGSKGLHISPADLVTAAKDFQATLDGEISAAVSQASRTGTTTYCQAGSGAALTGSQVLAGLPASLRASQVRNEAVDRMLLAQGADLSDSAVLHYYLANPAQFAVDCLSVIATDTQAHAQQYMAQINAGSSFASVATARSLDSASAARGGALGCNYTEAQVEQALQVTAVTVGKPIGPQQDAGSGAWIIYEVTKQTAAPLAQVSSLIRQELLQATANVNRVTAQVVAFARRSAVSVDPRYGTWKASTIVAPVAPPARDLLSAVSGRPQPSPSPAGGLGTILGGTGATGAATPGG